MFFFNRFSDVFYMLHKTRTIHNDAGKDGRPHAGHTTIVIQHSECGGIHF